MKNITKILFSGFFVFLYGLTSHLAIAAVDTEDFVDEASAKVIAEIETAKLALQKSTTPDIKSFAQKAIDDHTKNKIKLSQLARENNLEVSDDATLMDRAKAMILKWRDGENFDKAYVNNQISIHEQSIKLYDEYLRDGENAAVKQYVKSTLPTLEMHLKEAQELAVKYKFDDKEQ
ncbi:DUF4142 domain-containing protein [Azomonas macrocytogenes]|uniref:Putative membrane protein n=1 Tax=Azomonas macrocytogenes TaxID=69962 RepID=A0A839T1L1_AZOMA|nr:DUF4142 domain-containing protein [Azomonas macrocytogenes]MBB3102284.1 putative membrane protein [Azomonas macrocytogenes]